MGSGPYFWGLSPLSRREWQQWALKMAHSFGQGWMDGTELEKGPRCSEKNPDLVLKVVSALHTQLSFWELRPLLHSVPRTQLLAWS